MKKTNLATTFNFASHISESDNSGSSITIYKNGNSVAEFTGSDWEAEKLDEFFKDNFYAHDTKAPQIWSSEMPNFGFPNFLILHDEPSQFQSIADQLLKDSNGRKIAIGNRDNFMQIIQKYNLKKELGHKHPTLIGMDNENESFICPLGTNIKKCLSNINDGKIEMWMKSEPVPKDDSERFEADSKVRKVVAKEINDVVFDENCVYYDGPYGPSTSPKTTKTTTKTTKTTTKTTKPTTQTTTTPNITPPSGGLSTTAIIVVVFGCILAVGLFGLAACYWAKKKQSGVSVSRMFSGGRIKFPGGISNSNYGSEPISLRDLSSSDRSGYNGP